MTMSSESDPVVRSTPLAEPATEAAGPVLRPVLPVRFALTWEHLLGTLLFAALFLLLNYLPLRPTDLWGHVLWGRWILDHGRLPLEDPVMPLAAGMRVVNYAWLAQVLFAWIERTGGAEWLSNAFTLTMFGGYLVLGRACWLASRRVGVATWATALAVAISWSRLTTMRPENLGFVCFAVLLWAMVAGRLRPDMLPAAERKAAAGGWAWWVWPLVAVIFALWANVHASFVVGVAVLGCGFAGRALDVAWQARSLVAPLRDRTARRWLYLTELAAAATLVNPYGVDLWIEALGFSGNPNLRDVAEWAPSVITGPGGAGLALAALAWMVVLRGSRRPLATSDVLAVLLVGAITLWQTRMITWLGPLVAVVAAPHLGYLAARWWPTTDDATSLDQVPSTTAALPAGRSYLLSVVSVGVIWIAFAFSTLSVPLLGGAARSPLGLYGGTTPLGATEHLRLNPPRGLTYAPQWWGDWLTWAGPQGFQPFMTTNMHLVPRQVWLDYRRLSGAEANWDGVLNRYGVDTVIVDKLEQAPLASALRRAAGWHVRYEDSQAVIYGRGPAPGNAPSVPRESAATRTAAPTPSAVPTPTAAAPAAKPTAAAAP